MYHRFFLIPETFVLSQDEKARIFCNSTDNFLEGDVVISPERIKSCKVSGMNENIEISDFYPEGKSLAFNVPKLQDGLYYVQIILKSRIIDLNAEKFTSYLLHENLSEILNLIETQKLHKDVFKEEYTHHAKSLIQVGQPTGDLDLSIPLGHKIEIIPESNPQKLRTGDILTVRVLYEGQPLSFATISYGNSQYPYTNQTDEHGRAKIKLWRQGRWFIHTIHMVPSKRLDEIDWESFWATFTFEIRD